MAKQQGVKVPQIVNLLRLAIYLDLKVILLLQGEAELAVKVGDGLVLCEN